MRVPFPRLRSHAQPLPADNLNERDEAHTVRVPTRSTPALAAGLEDDEDEHVWARPEAAEQWDARRWSP